MSVVVPANNAERYISEAIESVLNQTFEDYELIIVNDGSTDRTEDIILDYQKMDPRIIYLKNEENLRICRTLNRGLEAARGDYIARMDADDWSYPARLEKQLDYMRNNPDVVLVGSFIHVADGDMNVLNTRSYPLTDREIRSTLLKYSTFAHPVVMYKRQEALKCGKYDPSLYDSEDYDFYFRIGRHGKFANLPETLLKLRTHKKSVSHTRIQRQTLLTLYIKLKAVVEYEYKMSLSDRLYYISHLLGSILIPIRIRFWLFNLIRK